MGLAGFIATARRGGRPESGRCGRRRGPRSRRTVRSGRAKAFVRGGLPLLALVVWVSGCGRTTGAPPPAAPPATQGTARGDLGPILEGLRVRHRVPALGGAIVTDDGVQALGVVGVRKWGDPTPALATDPFHLGSDGKAMTATLAARVVELGRLRWDSSLKTVFPDVDMHPAYREVTLAQLLAHRAGLPARGAPPRGTLDDVRRLPGDRRQQRDAYLRIMLKEPPESPPGERFAYSNLGYIIVGAMVERALDRPYEAALTTYVFEPLRMRGAGFGGMGTPGQVDAPWSHLWVDGAPRPTAAGPDADNPLAFAPAGTMHMPLAAWGEFVAEHLRGLRGRGTLLSPESYAVLHTPRFGGSYAGGWVVTERGWAGGRAYTHGGSNTMNFAVVWMAPRRRVAWLAVTNVGGDQGFAACDAVVRALRQVMPGRADEPAAPPAPERAGRAAPPAGG